MTLAGVHLYLSPSLPSVDSLRDIRLQTPLRIYSYDDVLIGEIGEKRRTPITYQDIPQAFIDALLSAEDAQFYSHNGVSIKGLMRASSQLLISGDIQGGGSTITMQVARNFFLSRKQEFKRKFNEILLALRIERELSKQEILALYVNVIFLGNRAYGIEAAANVYYGTTLQELTLPQLAMIAGLPKAPSTMNPLANPERALQRRNWILGRMHELGKIDDSTYQSAIETPLTAEYSGTTVELSAQYVAEMARQKAVEWFGPQAYTDGYKVFTTLDAGLQQVAQKAVADGLIEYDTRHGYRGPEHQIPPPEAYTALIDELNIEAEVDHANAESADTEPSATPVATSQPTLNAEAIEALLKPWHESLLAHLKQTPTYADMPPAAVTEVGETGVTALLKGGEVINIAWENGLQDARPYLSVNRRGPKPKSPSDVVSLGDIVRVRQLDGQWHFSQLPDVQGALVSLDANTGAVLALVGGMDFSQSNFNRITQATRQPGSNFKPFIYTAALENGLTAATVINDAPIVFEDSQLEGDWRPENASGKFYGPTRLRKALYLSRNLVSIRVLRSIGVGNALKDMGRFGFDTSAFPRDLSVALGSVAMTPWEVVRGYSTFANGGYQIDPYYIDRIEDAEGNIVFRSERLEVCKPCEAKAEAEALAANAAAAEQAEPLNSTETTDNTTEPLDTTVDEDAAVADGLAESLPGESETAPAIIPAPRVIDERVVYIMDSMLKDVVIRGTATKAKVIKRSDIAGKTGTTNQATNAWFSGYGGGLVTTAWVGFDQVSTLGAREFGGTAALPIWIDYMKVALEGRPEVHMTRPEGLVTTRINPLTGKRALPGTPDAIFEIFRAETVPELEDTTNATPDDPWRDPDMGTEDIF